MSLLPPTSLAGTYQNKTSNNNILQVKLVWVAPTGSDSFDKYYIYRNDEKLGEVEDTVLVYYDEDMAKAYNYVTYYITTADTTVDPIVESVPSVMLSNYSIGFEDLITRLRRLLMDYPNDPRMKRWTDEDLLEYLNIAIDDVNTSPPISYYSYETMPSPWRGLILTRAKFEAYISRGGLEVAKEFGFGFGGVTLNIDRSGKYLSVSDKEWQAYNERLTKAKLASVMQTCSPMGILSSDLPFKIRTYAPRMYRVR